MEPAGSVQPDRDVLPGGRSPVRWLDYELYSFRPAQRLPPSEWAELNVVLGAQSEEKGPINLSRTPHLRMILDVTMRREVEEVVFMKSAQIAGTTALISIAGFYADQEPCPIYLILADSDTAVYMSRERLQKMFEDSPSLSPLIGPVWNKEEMELVNGAYIAVGYGSSVTKLGSRSFRVVLMDEIDKPGYSLTTKEASAISLARERKETFYNFLLMLASTPTVESGNINVELNSCDVVYDFHVPCHRCGQYQPLRWSVKYSYGFKDGRYTDRDGKRRRIGEVVWKGGRGATDRQIEKAGYKCGSCGSVWSTILKNISVERGEWVPRSRPKGVCSKVGFHINRLYSLLGKSGDIPKLVREYIAIVKSNDPKQLQGFVNSTLAEPWVETVTKADEAHILKARSDIGPQIVPGEAIALTCGVDMQKRGFWFVVRAFSRDYTSWLVHYGFLPTWDDLGVLLFKTSYPWADERPYRAGIWRAALDTGGGEGFEDMASMTEQAYWWIRENGVGRGCRVWGTKGASTPIPGKVRAGSVIDRTPSGKALPGGLQLVLIDTNEVKDMYHYRIGQAKERGELAAYLHRETGHDYARQVTAEEKRLNEKGLMEWVKVRQDNHLLDAECLALACAEPAWPGGGVNILSATEKATRRIAQKRGDRSGKQSGKKSRW